MGEYKIKVEKRTTPQLTVYSQAGTNSKGTINRVGSTGTTGFYNLYVATSADSTSVSVQDQGTAGFVAAVVDTTSLPTTSFAQIHWKADSELWKNLPPTIN